MISGIRIGIPDLLKSIGGFSISSLFSSGEQGVWYDPSDLTTMFQDAAGTTPVTTVEQPVGLLLDKSKGLVLGAEKVVNGDFSSGTTGWSASTSSISVSSSELQVTNAGASFGIGYQAITVTPNTWNKISITLRAGTATTAYIQVKESIPSGASIFNQNTTSKTNVTITGYFYATLATYYVSCVNSSENNATAFYDNVTVKQLAGNHATQSTSTSRPVLSARYNLLLASDTLSTQNVTTVATNYVLSFSGTGSITLSGTKTGTYSAGTNTLTSVTAGTLTLTVTGSVTFAQLVPSNQSTLPYQRVTTATDYDADATKFPKYLKFDGVDDVLATSSFAISQPITAWSGFRIEATNGCLFNMAGPVLVQYLSAFSNAIDMYAKNHLNTGANTAIPSTNVHTYIFNGASSFNRVSGIFNASGNVGSANGSGVLYIGSASPSVTPLKGSIYSLIIRGAASTATQITNTETYVNSKTKAY